MAILANWNTTGCHPRLGL